jgi:hypothetical protein
MPTCKKCGQSVGLLSYDLSTGECPDCRRKAEEALGKAARDADKTAAYVKAKQVPADTKQIDAWKTADDEQYLNSPLYRELRRQTQLLTTIKTILLWVLVIIPVAVVVISIVLNAIQTANR